MLGNHEIIVIAIVVLILFGAGAIPKFAKSLGKAKKEFENGVKEGSQGDDTAIAKEKES
ncbi:MAG: twin-arginine translocase TatA/TatE family subunit [Treponema sp.]|jgi:sec-independent protein translocase protein TatA|nr:twin-arginine translocase TatA/TatE family subunit [Treponema sp.]